MPGIVEGFNYDVFVSCRQKENQRTPGYSWQSKEDGWVGEFAEAISVEFKEAFYNDESL